MSELRTVFRQLKNRGDVASSVIILVLIVGYGIIFAWLTATPPAPFGAQPVADNVRCPSSPPRSSAAGPVVKVSDASGPTATLNIFIGRDGNVQERQSAPLAIQKGSLCPGETLAATTGDLVRGDGATLPAFQVAAWGRVDSAGTHVTMYVRVAPRHALVSGFGGYSGVVSLADPHAVGANVLVDVHVLYPNINLVLAFSFLAAFGGFIWAWLVNDLRKLAEGQASHSEQYFWRNLILRMAIILATAIPVVNVQVLANPDWEGSLSQYIALATLAGAAAIALTPTLRMLALPPNLPAKPRGLQLSGLS